MAGAAGGMAALEAVRGSPGGRVPSRQRLSGVGSPQGGGRHISTGSAGRRSPTDSAGRPLENTVASAHTLDWDAERRGAPRVHTTFPWVRTELGRENVHLEPDRVVQKYGVRQSAMLRYIDGETQGEKDVLSLPGALILVLLFALMNLNHDVMNYQNSVEYAIDSNIAKYANFAFSGSPEYVGHKTYQDVNSFADFWSWMNKGFMPLINLENVTSSEASGLDLGELPPDMKGARGYYLAQNRRLGPIRLAQELPEDIPCPNPAVAKKYALRCFGENGLNLNLEPAEADVEEAHFREDTARTTWLNGYGPGVQAKMAQLETEMWLAQDTPRVQVSFLLYNGDSDLLTMTHVNFLFSRSGHIWKRLTHRTMKLHPYLDWQSYLFDVLFYVHVTLLCIAELTEIGTALMRSGRRPLSALKEYAGMWNMVDWVTILMSYVILILWLYRLSLVHALEAELARQPAQAGACIEDCSGHWGAIYDAVEEAGVHVRASSLVSAFFPLVILLRLFKAFSAQPRLALVTATLQLAANNLAHYLVVFVAIAGSYAVMGIAFFGRESMKYSTLDRAVPTVFQAVVRGVNYEDLQDSGRHFAFFYFVTFHFLVILVMLSMLIAIIMDVYIEVKRNSRSSVPVWAECSAIVRRSVKNWRGLRVPLPKIRAEYVKAANAGSFTRSYSGPQEGQDTPVFVADLVASVPGLLAKQAATVLQAAAREWAAEHGMDVKPEEVKDVIDQVVLQVQRSRGFLLSAEAQHALPMPGPLATAYEAAPCEAVPRPAADVLAARVPLQELLRAAKLRLDSGGPVPCFPGSEVLLRNALGSAQALLTELRYSANV